jgi:hypothetical protein
MNWFPVALAATASTLVLFGFKDPTRVISLLIYLAAIAAVWVVVEVVRERKAGQQKA